VSQYYDGLNFSSMKASALKKKPARQRSTDRGRRPAAHTMEAAPRQLDTSPRLFIDEDLGQDNMTPHHGRGLCARGTAGAKGPHGHWRDATFWPPLAVDRVAGDMRHRWHDQWGNFTSLARDLVPTLKPAEHCHHGQAREVTRGKSCARHSRRGAKCYVERLKPRTQSDRKGYLQSLKPCCARPMKEPSKQTGGDRLKASKLPQKDEKVP